MKKIFAIIITTISILIFVLSITIMVLGTTATKNNKLLYIGNYSFSIIPTSSMEGTLEDSLFPGDIAIIKKGSFNEVEIGDIVVFQSQISGLNALIIHRVIDIEDNGELITQGDNPITNPQPDSGSVLESEYQGTYSSKISLLRPIVILMFSSRGFIFLILFFIILVMLILEIVHIMKTIQEEKKKLDDQKHLDEMEALIEAEKKKIYEEILAEEKQKNQTK
ncbi:MAG TPA: signal peptidase I [Acholeplasmataceae bacterium]|nr:MAG: signal peptidase I [Tenericutes bacterium GWA2_38_26]OHE30170.1 MAG: signal peptidase I [Tenericutes bacterium GWC2_39_45]OHE31379.1 MAG: signal peptidase I [Tenericutes bacterium GWD2_38_27]OHE37069.1 MAG: signal peptidase I [Tenericutes bacterium GWE2_38_8]HBG32361.1 signal peptidase I [Acholeplasmataceae bacterium]